MKTVLTRRMLAGAVAAGVCFGTRPARADIESDVRALYLQFVTAQNARDLQAVRALLVETADFLWVTDGTAVWGRDAAVERMALFQKSEVWRVEPDLDKARTIVLGPEAAMLHLPLALVIGAAAPGPSRLPFLVEVVCRKKEAGWRIAALLTTTARAP